MTITIPDNVMDYIKLSPQEAFWILCKELNMEIVLDEDKKYQIVESIEYPEEGYKVACGDKIVDDRGCLFVALRNVAVNIYPNILFRSDSYIHNK